MPHTYIQYSNHFDDFDFKPLLASIATAFVMHCKAGMESTLGYTSMLDDVLVANDAGENRSMLWLQLRMKTGRSQEQKNAFMLAVHDAIEEYVMPFVRDRKLFCQPRLELTELSADYISMDGVTAR